MKEDGPGKGSNRGRHNPGWNNRGNRDTRRQRLGANAHVPALHALSHYELKAVCTAHEEIARASAEQFGADLAVHDMGAMVAYPDVDLIAIVVRVPLHKQLVMAAIEAKKPVCCEWPLGAHVAETAEMADSGKTAGVPTLVGLQAQRDPALLGSPREAL